MMHAVSLLAILVLAALAVRAEWRKAESGSLAWLYAVEFLDAKVGFAAGSNGTLLSTEDGGEKWKKLAVPVRDTIRDVHFLDRANGWMLCDRGRFRSGRNASYLLRTTDGGKTWSSVEFKESSERYSRLFFSPSGTGYLAGEGGILSELPSGGDSKDRISLPARYLIADGAVLDDSRILLTGGGGTLISSDDGGRSWRAEIVAGSRPDSKLNAIYFVDGQTGWVSGNRGTILSTMDGGRMWRPQRSGTEADILDIAFYDRANGFAVGAGGVVLRTSDSGRNWISEKSGSNHRLERLAFAGGRAVAVGFGGTIISTDLP